MPQTQEQVLFAAATNAAAVEATLIMREASLHYSMALGHDHLRHKLYQLTRAAEDFGERLDSYISLVYAGNWTSLFEQAQNLLMKLRTEATATRSALQVALVKEQFESAAEDAAAAALEAAAG